MKLEEMRHKQCQEKSYGKEKSSGGVVKKLLKNIGIRYKILKHTYIHCDICDQPERVTSKITSETDSVIWWSNAFHTINAQYLRGLSGVKECYENWCNQINEKNSNIWILGKDYLDKPVEGKI